MIMQHSNGDQLSHLKLHHDAFGRLVATLADGVQHVGVTPIRGFPVSDPEFGVSLCNEDGRELLWIANLGELPLAVREIIQAELAQREFMPLLQQVIWISTNNEPCEWEVETDRGRTRFVLKSDEDIRRIDAQRAMVKDSNGVAYLIENMQAMNQVSRRYLERYL